MTQEEFNAWITAQGGPQAVQFANENRTIPNPEKQDPANAIDPAVPPTITVNSLTWVNPTTGAKLSLSPKGPGQYDVIEQVGAKPANATASTGPARTADAEAQAANDLREKQWNQANGGLYETHAARKEREAKDAATADARAKAAAAETRAANAGGTIVEQADGVYILKPDGTSIKTTLAAKPKPSSNQIVEGADGKKYVVIVDADGNVSTKDAGLPAPSAGPPVPASATGWEPETSKIDMGIGPRKQAIAGMLESGVFGPPEDPKSVAKANELLKQDLEHAKIVSQNLGNIQQTEGTIYQGGITQRGQDTNTADNRLQAATATYNNAVNDILNSPKSAKSGATVVGAMKEVLNNYKLFVEQFGGLKDYDRIEPGANMARTSPVFQGPTGAAPAVPVAPGTGLESGGAVGFGGPPAAPGTGLESGGAVGIDPNAPSPPPAPDMPFTPPPTGAPTSITDQAQQARQLFGLGGPDPMAPTPPPTAVDPNQAAQAQALVGQRAPVTGGTLAWSRQLGFPQEVIDAFMAIENGPQVAA